MPNPSRSRHLLSLALGIVTLVGCSRRPAPSPGTPGGGTPGPRAPQNLTFDPTTLYRQLGMLARGLPLPFVGRVSYLASPEPDRSHVVVALSMATNALSFVRETDSRFRASYSVAVLLQRGTTPVARSETTEEVIVGSFRETTRTDESLVYQEVLDAPPGEYTLTVVVRDEGSQRSSQEQLRVRVPRFVEGSASTPVPILDVTVRTTRDSVPRLLTNPRATVILGRDSIIPVYVERYGAATGPLDLLVRNERGRLVWSDTVGLIARDGLASRVIEVPVARIGIGAAQVSVVPRGTADTASAGVFVGFGEDLPVSTFEDMIGFLRYFAIPARLDELRNASDEARPAVWAEFIRETDSRPETPVHEDLRDYFSRLVRANTRFREDIGPGWLSDRGRVYITLGEPDQVLEPTVADFSRNRQMLWEYRSLNLQLVFFDQSGLGRWRLTQQSASRFELEFRRRLR